MKILTLNSSQIANIAWVPDDIGSATGFLFVHFQRSGGWYKYDKVPWYAYTDILRAESHGVAFTKLVRDNYVYQQIDPTKWDFHV